MAVSVVTQEELRPGDLVVLDPEAVLRHSNRLFKDLSQDGSFYLVLLVLDGPKDPISGSHRSRQLVNVLYRGVPTRCMVSLLRRADVHRRNSD